MKHVAALLAVLLLGACASTDEIDIEPKELEDFSAKVKIKEVWSRDIGAGQDDRYTRLVPAVYGSSIYAVDIEGEVVAMDKSNGDVQWRVSLVDQLSEDEASWWSSEVPVAVSAGVTANAERLLIGTYKGEVIALNRADGAELWRARLSSEVLAEPVESMGVVVALTNDGKLYGIDAQTGAEKWMFESVQPVLTLRGTSAPIVKGDVVYAGFDNGKVYAFEIDTGLIQWEQRVAIPKGKTELERIVDIDGTPLLAGEILLAVSFQGRLVAFSSATGRPLWAEDASSVQGPAADYGQVYISGESDKVQAFSLANGVSLWENTDLLRRKLSPPVAWGDYVGVADYEGYLHLLTRDAGQMAARTRVDSDGVRAPMLVDGDTLYVLGSGGELSALKLKPL
ncbi:outer membrane protein assembly factor BamB [Simiduia sp. 21SJ11W-1]|uniref:outer membrane protein assembly factor BamB n=1 Tax=Simiduia sp. 21SJ11W-1 TaxID=2909669 RepID=UPI0020A22245|nr:outer membrane protein assembly factor BamB [Simiduia sp. 21SJ11W-1]UTA49184.1 outer membrane protein assembly factor BamB [Simiduia sp. 21SJ11W-1]